MHTNDIVKLYRIVLRKIGDYTDTIVTYSVGHQGLFLLFLMRDHKSDLQPVLFCDVCHPTAENISPF